MRREDQATNIPALVPRVIGSACSAHNHRHVQRQRLSRRLVAHSSDYQRMAEDIQRY